MNTFFIRPARLAFALRICSHTFGIVVSLEKGLERVRIFGKQGKEQ